MANTNWPNADELNARQKSYDELVAYFGGAPSDRASTEAFDLHLKIVRILNGEEPDPRQK